MMAINSIYFYTKPGYVYQYTYIQGGAFNWPSLKVQYRKTH